jgi:hypothetical protein
MNMDYDLIFTRKGADEAYLDIFKKDPMIGQVGKLNLNSSHWVRKMRLYMSVFVNALSRAALAYPKHYKLGEHCAGAFTILKENCLLQMYRNGFLKPPFSNICDKAPIADDPLLSFFTIASGYKMETMGGSAYVVWQMVEDYKTIPDREYYVYHPTKLVPGNNQWSVSQELACRNFFRGKRGQSPIIYDESKMGTFGRPRSLLI